MKQKTNTLLGVRVRSIFSALTLATFIAITLGSCSKTGNETQSSQPSSKVVSTEATPISGGAYYHNIQVYIPSASVLYASVKVGTGRASCRYTGGRAGWLNVNATAKQGETVVVTLYYSSCTGTQYGLRYFRAPGNDGLSNWWVKL